MLNGETIRLDGALRMAPKMKPRTQSEAFHETEVVIVSAVRTPVGKFLGALSEFSAVDLGAMVVREAVRRAAIAPDSIDECIMGCVLPAGLGQNPARQAALRGGLADTVSALTINMVCGSGLKAVALAAQAIMTGTAEIAVAGGMESMSNAPYLSAADPQRHAHGRRQAHRLRDQRRPLVRALRHRTWASPVNTSPKNTPSPAKCRIATPSRAIAAPPPPGTKAASTPKPSQSLRQRDNPPADTPPRRVRPRQRLNGSPRQTHAPPSNPMEP